MSFNETISTSDPKKIEMTPGPTEVGTKEDLGKNVSWELAQKFQPVEEKADYQVADKSVEEIQADINNYREQIKLGESRDNEQMVLENEAKLRAAEKLLINKQEQTKNANELTALREEIKNYREQIKLGENRDNEQMVLENEAKLKEVEKKIAALSNTAAPVTESSPETTPSTTKTPTEVPKKKKGFFSRLFSLANKK